MRAQLKRLLLALCACLSLALGLGLAVHGRALYHFRAAQQALDQDDPSVALEHLSLVLRVWPLGDETLLLAARAARRKST